ncbi:MAG: hypothetical protein AAF799_26680 [Myxococcota bacterium]
MNIWRWVLDIRRTLRDNGHARLAELIDELPSLAVDDEHARVDALVPEALALARAAREPWLEVFVRHWALQSQVLHRYEARERLAEAVSLLDFANRPETQGCPQSVCVTQDLAVCYACTDGPGYVQERLDVAAQTLARIDPSWPCFECISSEYASALQDDERHEEMLEWLQGQTDRAVAAGVAKPSRYVLKRASSLMALGRNDEAWALLEHHEAEPGGGTNREVDTELIRARVLHAIGRHAEARRTLPTFDRIAHTPSFYEDYVFAVESLVEAEQLPNDADLGARLRQLFERAEHNGAWFLAGQIATVGARLALARGAWWLAGVCVRDVDRIAERLRKPERLHALLQGERQTIEQGPPEPPALPDSVEEVGDALPDEPDTALEMLRAARLRWPSALTLVVMQSRALSSCGLEPMAEGNLREFIAQNPDDELAVLELARVLVRAKRHDALCEWVETAMQGEGLRNQALWLMSASHWRRDEYDPAAMYLEELLDRDPEADVPRARLAMIERRRGRHAEALAHLDRLVSTAEPGNHDWDRMTEAAALGKWETVRESAKRLEIELPDVDDPTTPIDLSMGQCRVRIVEDDGAEHDYYAYRRSPVTARVYQVTRPGKVEHYDDLVVFDAAPVNPRPSGEPRDDDDDDDRESTLPIYPAVAVLERGGYRTWSLDGTHPGDAAWEALEDGLKALGGIVLIQNDEEYQHEDPDGGEQTLPGVYAVSCVPDSVDVTTLHETLTRLTVDWPHPLVWPDLAEALPEGKIRDQALERVEQVTERYQL